MPNYKAQYEKQIKDLQDYIRSLESRVETLSIDPSYGILTRRALELEVEARKREFKFVIFGDVNYLHDFNKKHGHEEANNRIRRALHFRSSDLAGRLSGKWYSGDEIAILIPGGDPIGFIASLEEAFEKEGMSITLAYAPFTGDLKRDVARAKTEVDRIKRERGVSER